MIRFLVSHVFVVIGIGFLQSVFMTKMLVLHYLHNNSQRFLCGFHCASWFPVVGNQWHDNQNMEKLLVSVMKRTLGQNK